MSESNFYDPNQPAESGYEEEEDLMSGLEPYSSLKILKIEESQEILIPYEDHQLKTILQTDEQLLGTVWSNPKDPLYGIAQATKEKAWRHLSRLGLAQKDIQRLMVLEVKSIIKQNLYKHKPISSTNKPQNYVKTFKSYMKPHKIHRDRKPCRI